MSIELFDLEIMLRNLKEDVKSFSRKYNELLDEFEKYIENEIKDLLYELHELEKEKELMKQEDKDND